MANYPMNIWVISEDEFDEFTFTGGKVIYIVEEPELRFTTHPAIITAGSLLPPFEAIHPCKGMLRQPENLIRCKAKA